VLSCVVKRSQFCEKLAVDWVGHVLKGERDFESVNSCFLVNSDSSVPVLCVVYRSDRIMHVATIDLTYVMSVG
jgi:hypothetical protein